VEDATRELSDARAAVSEADHAASAAETLGKRDAVAARFDGVIATRWHNPGDIVEAAASDPILRVIDPARLQVEALVPLAALAQVEVGAPARVFGPGDHPGGAPEPGPAGDPNGGSATGAPGGAGDRKPLDGAVLSRPASVEPSTGTAVVRVSLKSTPPLAAGTPVQIEILTEEHTGALIVPASAVIRERSESLLCVVDGEGRAHRRRVDVGIVTSADAEILSGAAEGDRVVVRGQDALPDGADVTPVARMP
jgi:RND family efflux transporter MFP subunit